MSTPKYNKSILNLYNNEEKILTKGFVPLANTIHLYKDELGLNLKEIGLITQVLSSVFQNKPIVSDKDLSPDGKAESKRRNFKYQRQKLKEKGYLETKVIKDYDNGFKTLGIKYDFSGLWIKIKELVERDEALNGNIEKPKEKNNSNKNSSLDENNFLQEYNKLHKQIVGTEVNFEK